MKVIKGISLLMICGAMLISGGCTKKPSQEELTRLEESKAAAEAAEKKLSELRSERQGLESTLDGKKQELQKLETEKETLKSQTGK